MYELGFGLTIYAHTVVKVGEYFYNAENRRFKASEMYATWDEARAALLGKYQCVEEEKRLAWEKANQDVDKIFAMKNPEAA